LEVDALRGRVTLTKPRLPRFLDCLEIERLPVGTERLDLRFTRHPDDVGVAVLTPQTPVEVTVIK